MTHDDITDAMALVGDAWPIQRNNFTKGELELWRNTLIVFDLGAVSATIGGLVRRGQKWRPSVAEFAEAYRAYRRGELAVPQPKPASEPAAPMPAWLQRMRVDRVSAEEAKRREGVSR